jgi:hypothetical protein
MIVVAAMGGSLPLPQSHASAPIDVHARSIAQPPALTAGRRIGELELAAAFELTSGDRRFGGLSGLLVEGDRLTAVSDRATLWTADMVHDRSGVLTGLRQWRVEAVGAVDRLGGPDIESLARLPDGSLVAAAEGPARPLVLEGRMPPGLDRMAATFADLPLNDGIEALTTLPDGSVLALAEAVEAGDLHPAAVMGPGGVRRLRYGAPAGFRPTAADRSGDRVIVLERRLSLLGGLEARLAVIDVDDIGEGAVIGGDELARLGVDNVAENFEGVAAAPAPDGRVALYVLADDNFSPLQRTLLLQLFWRPE